MNDSIETTVESVALTKLHESPTNPWHGRDVDDDFVASIRSKGVIQPLLVRPKGKNAFEIVCGNRRFRGAKAAGLVEVNCVIRRLSDVEALECQIIENAQRKDTHPIEDAEAYQRLQAEHGLAVEDIAAKVGKSVAHVYQRLKLCALTPKARKAALAGDVSPATALRLARIPVPKLQDEALEHVNRRRFDGEGVSTSEAARIIEQRYMLALKDAPFSTTDAELVSKAGPCSTCPKRTGAQPELFTDVKSADVCTDPTCFAEKREAGWKVRVKEHAAAGGKVLSAAETKKLFPYEHSSTIYGNGYVDLGAPCYDDPKHRTWKKVLGKDKPEVVLVRHPSGAVHELVSESTAKRIAASNGIKLQSYETSPAEKKRAAEAKAANVVRRAWTTAAIAELVEQAADEGTSHGADSLRLIAQVLIDHYSGSAERVAKRRGVETDGKGDLAAAIALKAELPKMSENELVALMLEVACQRETHVNWGAIGDEDMATGHVLIPACELFEIDWRAHKARAERGVEEKAPGAKKKAPAKKTPTPKAKAKPKKKGKAR